MRRISRIERRSLLTGWIKWALLPAIPFCVFFFDAWLNVQVRSKDYEQSQLYEVRRRLNTELDMVRAKEAGLSGVEHLTEMAAQLELSPPSPQQFRTVSVPETSRRIPVMNLATEPEIPSQPTLINLEKNAPVALARNTAPAAVGTSPAISAAQVEAAPERVHDVAPEEAFAQPAVMFLEDAELGVEDMLGKL